MLSGGARCRQTARHLATSPVTSLVLRAPAAPSPARRQPSPACGLEASALRPSRPPPAEVGRVPEPLPRLPALGLGGLPAFWPELLSVQMTLRDRRTPLRWPSAGLVAGTPENQEPDCAQLCEGAVVQHQDLRERLALGHGLGQEVQPLLPPTPRWPQGTKGFGRGFVGGALLVIFGVCGQETQALLLFAFQPGRSHAQAQVCQAATSPGPAVRAHPTVSDVLFPLPATARG